MYVDAHYDRLKDTVHVVERVNGKRKYIEYPAKYVFYYEDKHGRYESIFGNKLEKFETTNGRTFQKELKTTSSKVFESDINPLFRCLSDNYSKGAKPKLNLCFFDIEVDFHPEHGYASVDDPFNPVTAISLYLSHVDKLICLAVPPKTLTPDQAEKELEGIPDTYIFDSEKEMLLTFLDLIEDADILSGWNSTSYDIPYIVGRIEMTLGKEYTKKLCLWDIKPKKRTFKKFNKDHTTYDLVGRVHLDYLELYMKHSQGELHSYRLDYVGEIEIGENKTPYEGTLDQLYNNDFRKFVIYSRQDTLLLKKIDDKRKYIDLANGIAHTNCVQFLTTKGSVALIEQAIINEAHSMGLIVPSKKFQNDYDDIELDDDDEDEMPEAVAGAYVVDPKRGLHDWIGSVDINSLYPSVIRSFNMSPETLVGQIRPELTEAYIKECMKKGQGGSAAWGTIFTVLEFTEVENKTQTKLWLDFEDGTSHELTAAEIYYMIYESGQPWALTANGTIFRTDKVGVIPHILTRWYVERQQMQKKSKTLAKMDSGLNIVEDDNPLSVLTGATASTTATQIPNYDGVNKRQLVEQIADDFVGKKIDALREHIQLGYLKVTNTSLVGDTGLHEVIKDAASYWDEQQYVRKIMLNSLYGALLNQFMRFYDARIGQSTTLTGRNITKHMSAHINEQLTGKYDNAGDAIIYGDTDSAYFSAYKVMRTNPKYAGFDWNDRKAIIDLYDNIAENTNATFPSFMQSYFNVPPAKSVIAAGREVVAIKGLFIKKKRYAVLIIDLEGKRMDKDGKPGKIKAMGLDLKRTDTPIPVQDFLEATLTKVLTGESQDTVIDYIKEFRTEFREWPSWKKGTPKKVNALTDYQTRMEQSKNVNEYMRLNNKLLKSTNHREQEDLKRQLDGMKKVNMPGHVRASLNWNTLRGMNHDLHSMPIMDGQKIIVCKLRNNPLGYTSIAYPIDEQRLPGWFKELPFDNELMEETLIDAKIDNLIGILETTEKWDLSRSKNDSTFDDLFGL